MNTFKVTVKNNNSRFILDKKTAGKEILSVLADQLPYPCYLMKVNNAYRALSHLLYHDSEVEFLDIRSQAAWLVYQNSLTLLYLKAVHDVLGKACVVSINNSLNKGLFTTLDHTPQKEEIAKIYARMKELSDLDLPIRKEHYSKEAALELAEKSGLKETAELLKTLKSVDDVQIYSLDDEVQFFYSETVPSTSYLKFFDLYAYRHGLILAFPHPEDPLALPKREEQPILYNAFKEAENWGKLLAVDYLSDLNKNDDLLELVLMQEALHEKKIAEMAEAIRTQKKRVVLICGPSSSGKTTFAKRLCIQLKVAGVRTLYLGTDDYFKDEEEKPRNEKGEIDLETINAVDVPLFIDHLQRLLKGEEVDLPVFDFTTSRKIFHQRYTRIDKDEVIVIEGIHALNAKLTEGIEEAAKYKIYISPFTPLGIDRHNRIPTTDARMLRRLVRDCQFRGREPERVLDEWIKVRESENTNIFPFHKEADIFFNSNCIYELAILKKYAEPLLEKIPREKKEFSEARRMISFLKFIRPLNDESIIPNNSIVREFIGGSSIVK